MFLLTRSAICIAMVVAALPDKPAAGHPPVVFDTVASETGRIADAAVERFCRRDPMRCLSAAATVADAAGLLPAGHAALRGSTTPVPRS